jgi:hypothetical protein
MKRQYFSTSGLEEALRFGWGDFDEQENHPTRFARFRFSHPVPKTEKRGTRAEDWPEIADIFMESEEIPFWMKPKKEGNWRENITQLPIRLSNRTMPETIVTFCGINKGGKYVGGNWLCRMYVDQNFHPKGTLLTALSEMPEKERDKILAQHTSIDPEGEDPLTGDPIIHTEPFIHCGYVAQRKVGNKDILVPCDWDTCPFAWEETKKYGLQKICSWNGIFKCTMPWTGLAGEAVLRTRSYVSIHRIRGALTMLYDALDERWRRYLTLRQEMQAIKVPEDQEQFRRQNYLLMYPPKPPSLKNMWAIISVKMRPQEWQGRMGEQPVASISFTGYAENVMKALKDAEPEKRQLAESVESVEETLAKIKTQNAALWDKLQPTFFPESPEDAKTGKAKKVFGDWILATYSKPLNTLDGQKKAAKVLAQLITFHEFYQKQQKLYDLPESPLDWAEQQIGSPVLNWWLLTSEQQNDLNARLGQIREPVTPPQQQEAPKEGEAGKTPSLFNDAQPPKNG